MEPQLEAFASEGMFLQTTPEFAMKRLLAAGHWRIYQIAPCFRKDEMGRHHSAEFSMLEWYRAGIGLDTLISDTEKLIQIAANALGTKVPLFKRFTASSLLSPDLSPEEWFFRWVDEIEPSLPEAVIVTDYPIWQAALARTRETHAERFEIYLHGIELANAFHEELDGSVLRNRWLENNAQRIAQSRVPHPLDEAFLSDLNRMPRTSGIAMGIDRLTMALCGAESIQLCQSLGE